jgi:hypothetical protein
MAKRPRANNKLTLRAKVRRAASLGLVFKEGWYVLPSRGGPPVTTELVQRLLDDVDLEDAGVKRNNDHRA